MDELSRRAVDAAAVGWGVDVLDVGSPGGAAAVLAASRGATVVGLQSAEALGAAAVAADEAGVVVDWMPFEGVIPCPPQSMDRVLVLVADLAPAEVMRVLRPGGTFVAAGAEEAAVRTAYEQWGVRLEVEPAGGGVLAVGRLAR